MIERPLRERVEALLEWSLAQTTGNAALEPLSTVLAQCRDRLEQPMRVAIVGLIKAGKSTMMNALLGESVVATGTVEATFNVNWLRYGDEPSVAVHFKDGRPPEPKSFEELTALTVRADEHRDYLLSIKYVEVAYPSPILRSFNLIDTPGLESHFKDDSQNTLDFLSLHGKELDEATQTEASNADAVLYLFSQSIHSADQSIAEQFQGPAMGQPTPINAIGVLTKTDYYWPDVDDPLDAGRRIARRLRDDPKVRGLFYTVYPVAGLVALGAKTIDDAELESLQSLAALPEERFDRLIRSAERFAKREYEDVPVSPDARKRLLDRLGQFGVALACERIRAGATDRERLGAELLDRSGVPDLGRLVTTHFGSRAFLIKLNTAFRQIAAACFRERQRVRGAERETVEEIAGRFEALEAGEHAFHELRVLRSHYQGHLAFDATEIQNLLEVNGEFGRSCAERLGLDERAHVDEMIPIAEERHSYWRHRADDPLAADRQTLEAAHVMARSYERILYRVRQASALLME